MNNSDKRSRLVPEWLPLEAAGLAACLVDRQLQYRRASAAWTAHLQGDTFQYGQQQISLDQRDLLPDIPSAHRERWSGALSEIVQGKLGHFLDRIEEHATLGTRTVVMTASPTVDADGQVDGALCVRYDLTKAQQSAANEEQLTQVLLTARRLQHFLGNQLSLTLGYVELMSFDRRVPDELRDRVDEALRGVVEATETLSMLRRVTRLELAGDDPTVTEYLGRE